MYVSVYNKGLGIAPVAAFSAITTAGKLVSKIFGGGKEALTLQGEKVIRMFEGTWHQTSKIPRYLPPDLKVKYDAARSRLTGELNTLSKHTTAHSNRRGGEGTQLWAIRGKSILQAVNDKLTTLSGVIEFDLTKNLWTENKNTPLPPAFVAELQKGVAGYKARAAGTVLPAQARTVQAGFMGGVSQPVVLLGIAGLAIMLFKD